MSRMFVECLLNVYGEYFMKVGQRNKVRRDTVEERGH